ncbi:MAG: hypothetical protein WC789_11250 [Lentisphaeria bacterium]|jgi:hypothetical protein
MPRKSLSPEQKNAMQAARKDAKAQKEAALQALESNVQFVNPKFWAGIDAALYDDVANAIAKAERSFKKSMIKELERQLAELKSEA